MPNNYHHYPDLPPPPPQPGRSPHWPHVRAVWLHSHPTCAACGGTESVEVHHKRPYHLYPALELDPTNFITLCEHQGINCHFVFGHAGNWHGYVPTVSDDAGKHLADVQLSNQLAKDA